MLAHRPQTAAFLRFINGLPKGYIFTTRDLIPFAPRSTLDSALCRMVKGGILERLARGVFRLYDPRNRKVSVRQIAAVKRRAFGRKICTVATFIDKEDIERLDDRGRELLKPSSHTLVSDGRTSSFLFHQDGSRINLKSAAMRINRLGETSAGRMLRDLWLQGCEATTLPDVWDAWDLLSPRDIAKVPALKRLLPNWLVKMLPPTPSQLVEQLMIRPVKRTVYIKPRKKPNVDLLNNHKVASQKDEEADQKGEERTHSKSKETDEIKNLNKNRDLNENQDLSEGKDLNEVKDLSEGRDLNEDKGLSENKDKNEDQSGERNQDIDPTG